MKKLILPFVATIFWSCGPTTKNVSVMTVATPLPAGTEVQVLGLGQSVPAGAKIIGSVKIGDGNTMAKNCTYTRVVADAQEQARGLGGNVLQITKHKQPDLWSTCHRLWADVYLIK